MSNMVAKVKGASAKFNAAGYVSANVYPGVRVLSGTALTQQKDRARRALAKVRPRTPA